MPKFETFGEFVRVKFKTQANAAKLLKTKQNVISNWVTGRNNPEPEMQDLLRDKWGYDGGWPIKAKEAATGAISPDVFHRTVGQLEGRIDALERALERTLEGFRHHMTKRPDEAHPQASA